METRRSDVSIRNGHGVSEEAAGAPGRAPQGPPQPGAGGSRSPVLTEHGSNLRSVRRSELRERRKTGEKTKQNKNYPCLKGLGEGVGEERDTGHICGTVHDISVIQTLRGREMVRRKA